MAERPPPCNGTPGPPTSLQSRRVPDSSVVQPDIAPVPSAQKGQVQDHNVELDHNPNLLGDEPSPFKTTLLKSIDTLNMTLAKRDEALMKQRSLIRQKEEMISHLIGGAQPFDPRECWYCGRSGETELIVEREPFWEPATGRNGKKLEEHTSLPELTLTSSSWEARIRHNIRAMTRTMLVSIWRNWPIVTLLKLGRRTIGLARREAVLTTTRRRLLRRIGSREKERDRRNVQTMAGEVERWLYVRINLRLARWRPKAFRVHGPEAIKPCCKYR